MMSPSASALLADGLDRALDAITHRAEEVGQAWRLGEQPLVAVVDRNREVEDVVDDRRERGAHQRPFHLLGRGVEAVPHDLGCDRVDALSHSDSSGSIKSEPLSLHLGREPRIEVGHRCLLGDQRGPGERAHRPRSGSGRAWEKSSQVTSGEGVGARPGAARLRRWRPARVPGRAPDIAVRSVPRTATISIPSSILCPKILSYCCSKDDATPPLSALDGATRYGNRRR